ncbi:hypothetical protein [Acidiphilium acidophilum]|uniref:Uncharacterized protein n=1 Tax=Acidiphilium acidophilum TaxID=76588 RepID=A0AAW9DR22_ACIAO|nr:hypothetical protein [Acidiphilium acidophilum]MDX5930507.1 hypothetical protein [Acidiphilium acidophilum]
MIRMNSHEGYARIIDLVARVAPWRLPLYSAAMTGQVRLVEMMPDSPLPKALERPGKPTVILIGDDAEQPLGPVGWRCVRRLRRTARCAIVHATGGERKHYATAVVAASMAGSLVLIETNSEHADAWRAQFQHLPGMMIVCPPGQQHPRVRRPETVQ